LDSLIVNAMSDSQPTKPTSSSSLEDEALRQQSELEALQYENKKLKKINDVLMQRVEMGWGNTSNAYSSFQNAALLAEKVKSRTIKLRQTQHKLEAAHLDLSLSRQESEVSRQRLYDMVESISDAILLFDSNRRLILANSHFYDFWENTEASIEIGETRLSDLVQLSIDHGIYDPDSDPNSPQQNTSDNQAEDSDGKVKDSVFRLANGRWLQMSECPTSDDGLVVVYTDITKIKEDEIARREQVLAEKNRILQSTLDNLPQGVSLVNANNEIEFWNQRFLELVGLPASQVRRGGDFVDLLKDSEVQKEAEAFRALQAEDNLTIKIFEKEKRLSNGVVLDLRSNMIPDGGYVNTYTDITERSRNAEALRESNTRIRLITNAMPALISYINSNLHYEFANKAFEEWFDRPSEEIEGLYIWQVLGESEYANHKNYVADALLGKVVNFEVEQQLPHQRRRISNKTYIPHYSAENEVVGFFALEQDVTSQRRTSEALQHAYKHMEQRVFERTKELNDLNKQLQLEIQERALIEEDLLEATREAEEAGESKVKFMAAAGHDLLQPMNAARLFSAALLDKELDEDIRRLALLLSQSMDDVESIITTLVDISKLEAGVVEPIPDSFVMHSLLRNLANEFGPQAQQADLQFKYVDCHAVVHTDSQLLARILRNFLSNAMRYTESGKLSLGCRRRPEGVEVQVCDTGIGIDADKLQLVFQEFQRVHATKARDDKGLGLGLAIVEKLSRVLGLEVRVQSEPGRGSVFSVLLPYGKISAQEPLPKGLVMLEAPLQGRRILVIDNEDSILEGMEIVLSSWGCEVIAVQSLDELAQWERTLSPPPDLVIVDYQLDDGDTGFDAIELINQQLAERLPVVMITANYTKELREQVSELGYRLLNKPVKPLKLRSILTHLLSS
jgi:two-component system, sensor histidine kinase